MISLVQAREHVPDRPAWDCRCCTQPWPCDPAREGLTRELDRVGLAVSMWCYLEAAATDRPDDPPGELFDRFISWTR